METHDLFDQPSSSCHNIYHQPPKSWPLQSFILLLCQSSLLKRTLSSFESQGMRTDGKQGESDNDDNDNDYTSAPTNRKVVGVYMVRYGQFALSPMMLKRRRTKVQLYIFTSYVNIYIYIYIVVNRRGGLKLLICIVVTCLRFITITF